MKGEITLVVDVGRPASVDELAERAGEGGGGGPARAPG